jgi:hypothetical protein
VVLTSLNQPVEREVVEHIVSCQVTAEYQLMVRPSTAEVIAAGGWSEPKLPKPQPSDSASIRGEVLGRGRGR